MDNSLVSNSITLRVLQDFSSQWEFLMSTQGFSIQNQVEKPLVSNSNSITSGVLQGFSSHILQTGTCNSTPSSIKSRVELIRIGSILYINSTASTVFADISVIISGHVHRVQILSMNYFK